MRMLASVQQIAALEPIKGADRIELATVLNWSVVVKRGEYKVGDWCVYYEIDSLLPDKPEYEFLGKPRHRLRTVKLRGQISQGLVMPLPPGNYEMGQDLTELLGVDKYEPAVPAELAGVARGSFPTWLSRTEETRVQCLSAAKYEALRAQYDSWLFTEKLDGTSCTFYCHNGVFGVCSRNLDLLESPDNKLWQMARKLDIERKLSSLPNGVALQGELIGPGIQGNRYKLPELQFRLFTVQDIERQCRCSIGAMEAIASSLDLQMAPLVQVGELPATVPELLLMAEGASLLNSGVQREGLVLRAAHDQSVSYKAISNKYLLKEQA